MPTNYSNELRKRTIRTSGEGMSDGAQRNARIAAAVATRRTDSKENKEQLINKRTADAEQRKKEAMRMAKEEIMTEAKKFVYDKPLKSDVAQHSKLDTEHLKDMHSRWVESHKRDMGMPKSAQGHDERISDRLLAVHHILKNRGVDVGELPQHRNLGVPMNEETNTEKRMRIKNVARMDDSDPTSEKSTLGKTGQIKTKIVEEKPTMSMPNFGLSSSLIAAARQIVEKKDDTKLTGGKTEVDTDPEINTDDTNAEEDAKVSAKSSKDKKKKLDPVGKEDDDVDNDGDVDKSDSYLKNRRKAIGKAIKEEEQLEEGPFGGIGKTLMKSKLKAGIAKSSGEMADLRVKRTPFKDYQAAGSDMDRKQKALDRLNKEEVELDEVSKSTLGSYIKKASDDATKHSYMAAKTGDLGTAAKASKRIRGIAKASDMLTKEDFTADELARIDEIAQSIFEIAAPGINQNGKQDGINVKGDVTNAVLSDEKKSKMSKK